MCKVSVLMPSLNVAKYIRQCMESVVSQTLKDIEILCIDAGSTDGTLEILEEYAAGDARVRLIHADKKSYGYQMNLGLKEAKGEYIGIVETDDFAELWMFERLYNKAAETGADVVKGQLIEVYENKNGEELEMPISYVPADISMGKIFSPGDHTSVFYWDHNIWNGIYRRSFLLDKGILFQETPGAACQDVGFRQQVLMNAASFVYIPDHLYHYRKIRNGASTMDPKCLRFAYQEYSELEKVRKSDYPGLKEYYVRMVGSFLYEIDKAFCYAGFDRSKLECPEGLEWFISTADEALKDGLFTYDDLDPWNKERFIFFRNDLDMYVNSLKAEMESVLPWAKNVKDRAEKQGMVLFGAGSYGQMLLIAYIRSGAWPVAIADNNPSLHHMTYYGIKVFNAADAVIRYPDAVYLIANKGRVQEMKQQLILLGIKEENIEVFDGKPEGVVDNIHGMFHRPPLFHCYLEGLSKYGKHSS